MSYQTKQSTEVLEFLKQNSNRHLTADEVYFMMREGGSTVGRTTVYRHLEKLYNDGIIRKFQSGEGSAACFQIAEENGHCHNHFHLRCLKCGKLFHTECDFMENLSGHIFEEHGFKVDSEKTVIYGTCKECQQKGL